MVLEKLKQREEAEMGDKKEGVPLRWAKEGKEIGKKSQPWPVLLSG